MGAMFCVNSVVVESKRTEAQAASAIQSASDRALGRMAADCDASRSSAADPWPRLRKAASAQIAARLKEMAGLYNR